MTTRTAFDSSDRPEIIDLPPEIAALIDAAMARAVSSTAAPRPVVPIVRHPARDASRAVPRFDLPAERIRVPALENLALVGLFFAVILACWLSILVSLDIAKAAEGAPTVCTLQAQTSPGRPALPAKLCDRLPRQG